MGRELDRCGDFNMIMRSEERNNGNFVASGANEFREMIDKLILADLPLLGGQWIWTNMKNQLACSRIDRFLISPGFLVQLTGVYQKILLRPISNHYPTFLESEGIQWDSIPFWIDTKWLNDLKFCALVEEKWKNTVIQGKASFRIARKLKELKDLIKVWTGREEEGRGRFRQHSE